MRLAAILAVFPISLFAQNISSGLSGIVQDPGGAAIAAAQVVIAN